MKQQEEKTIPVLRLSGTVDCGLTGRAKCVTMRRVSCITDKLAIWNSALCV